MYYNHLTLLALHKFNELKIMPVFLFYEFRLVIHLSARRRLQLWETVIKFKLEKACKTYWKELHTKKSKNINITFIIACDFSVSRHESFGTCLTGLPVVSWRISCGSWINFKWWYSASLLGQHCHQAAIHLNGAVSSIALFYLTSSIV